MFRPKEVSKTRPDDAGGAGGRSPAGDLRVLLGKVSVKDNDRGRDNAGRLERADTQLEDGDREQSKKRRVSELEHPDILAADKRMQGRAQDGQAEHRLVAVRMPEVPDAVQDRLEEVEVLGVDVEPMT